MEGEARVRADSSLRSALPVLLLAATAAVTLFRTARDASNLDYTPDSVEYALVGDRFVAEGRLGILLEGRLLPSRYPPWFSLVVLAPAYLILGPEPGNAIYGITFLGVAGIVAAWLVGRQEGSGWAGAAAAIATLALPTYRSWGRQIMTDVPCAALLIAACLVYVRMRVERTATLRRCAAAGTLVALASLFRPLCGAAILPFALPILGGPTVPPPRWKRFAALAAPLLAAIAATLAYNAATFGSPLRNGYQFWAAVPYDYPSLTFSTSYIQKNLYRLQVTGFWYVAAAAGILLALHLGLRAFRRGGPRIRESSVLRSLFSRGLSGPDPVRAIAEFTLLGVLPMGFFHVFYFFAEDRFYLPQLALFALLAGSIAGGWLEKLPRSALHALLAVTLILAAAQSYRRVDPEPKRLRAVERILAATPDDALIVSAIDPVYLEYMLGADSRRRVMPLSRRIEYASKVIVRTRIDDPRPPPRSWADHRSPGILKGGAEEAVRTVAAERPDLIEYDLRKGTRAFLDTSLVEGLDDKVMRMLERRFRLVPAGDSLLEIERGGP